MILRTWSKRRARKTADALTALRLLVPSGPLSTKPPRRAEFMVYRFRWWQRWRVALAPEVYGMDFDSIAWKVRHHWGAGPVDVRTMTQI